ncbi:MAG: NUDIX hydrolase [Acidimicrobiales bacterium]
MNGFLHRCALRVYSKLPVRARRHVVRAISPSFTVGAMCIIERDDGAILLVRHSYRERWGVPGGLLQRGEDVGTGARREVHEEVGLMIEILGEPAVVVDADPQRVDVVFRCRPALGAPLSGVGPRSPEIIEARWFSPDELPELQFETASALVTLARAAVSPVDRRLPEPVWPRFD